MSDDRGLDTNIEWQDYSDSDDDVCSCYEVPCIDDDCHCVNCHGYRCP
jgi:hypothetical protein